MWKRLNFVSNERKETQKTLQIKALLKPKDHLVHNCVTLIVLYI